MTIDPENMGLDNLFVQLAYVEYWPRYNEKVNF